MREQSVADRHKPSAPVNRVTGHVVESTPLARLAPKPEVHRRIKPAFEFPKAVLLEENHIKTGSRTLSGAIAVLLHVGVIAGLILVGLYFADPLNIKQFASTMLVGTTTSSSPSAACERRSDQVEGCPPHAYECGETLGTDGGPEAHCGDQGSTSGTG